MFFVVFKMRFIEGKLCLMKVHGLSQKAHASPTYGWRDDSLIKVLALQG